MKWLQKIFRSSGELTPERKEQLYLDALARNMQGGVLTDSGQWINEHNALGLVDFFAGVRLIATTIARCDCAVQSRAADGYLEIAREHEAHALIGRQPNPYQTRFNFTRQLVSNSIWSGNGYAYIHRENHETQALYLLDPNHTAPVIVYGGRVPEVFYLTVINGHQIRLDYFDVLHLRSGICDNGGWTGLSLVETAKQSLGLAVSTLKYGAIWYQQGGAVGAKVISLPKFLDPKDPNAEANFRKTFEDGNAGIENWHKASILQGGATMQVNSISLEEAAFLGSRLADKVSIATLLGLNASKLNAPINSSYGSIEIENLALLSDLYDGILTNLEQEYELKLLKEVEKQNETHVIRFNRDDLTKADKTTETNNWVMKVNNGLNSLQDYFRATNQSLVKNPDEEWRIPNGVTIEGEEPPAPPVATLEAAPDETEEQTEEQPEQEKEDGKEAE